ncbi:YceI family protein [Mucilaginibacter terrae]|uniref:Polyisoprenoid-binding protein YceI n=1 Tax=Mucilaginibacter terrae TaxID=1955052 RepID=A0ABU3GTK8_9SPHI|nr:YceI family protein [Mucilaginibacter terrae]MDT3402985.1 polyisoprenoid-binding protein YceI [Mucilaginibacter terrae]
MIKKHLIILLLVIQASAYAQQAYQLDVSKSKVLWNTRQTMGGHYGYLLFSSGTLIYSSAGQPVNGVFSMDMNSIRSEDHEKAADNQKVDQELRKPGFFDIDKYPTSTMRVLTITQIGKTDKYKVNGDLTIKGITNPIEFTATLKKKGGNIIATAALVIDRLIWHIDLQSPPQAKPKPWELVTTLENKIKNKIMVGEVPITLKMVFTR